MAKYDPEFVKRFRIDEAVDGFAEVLSRLGYELNSEEDVIVSLENIIDMWDQR